MIFSTNEQMKAKKEGGGSGKKRTF